MVLNIKYLTSGSIFEILRYAALIIGLLFACWQDINKRSVSNWLTGIMVLIGLLCGKTWLGDRLIALCLPFCLFLPLFAWRVMGAGDIKLLMALGALMGCSWLLRCLLYTILLGGIMALLLMLKRGIFLSRLRYFFSYCYQTWLLHRLVPYQIWDSTEKLSAKHFFPFVLAITLGSLMASISYAFY